MSSPSASQPPSRIDLIRQATRRHPVIKPIVRTVQLGRPYERSYEAMRTAAVRNYRGI